MAGGEDPLTAASPHEGGDGPQFDAEALREKYRQERARRLRADGSEQYLEASGAYLEDPYVEPGYARAPLTDAVEVVVIGGGIGGVLTAARLREAGVRGVRLIEKAGDFGGAWYWNRYPGAACDIESYIYLPLLEAVGYVPVEKYSRQPEILDHIRAIGRRFGLYEDACFQTEVTELRWDETAAHWIVRTNRDDAIRARFVCMANGPLHKPKLPGIPGVETFKGHAFHTSRWDYSVSGGDTAGALTGLGDLNVGVIGTGATAVQVVPQVGRWAKHLYVFQRTPSSIDVRNNRPTDPDWARRLEPGWQQRRMDNFTLVLSGAPQAEDLVGDAWTDSVRAMAIDQAAKAAGMDEAALIEMADFRKMEELRARIDAVIDDPATAEALKPWYKRMCKRPCFHDDYLATFNRPNVTLVDTRGRGVERVTPTGVVVDGRDYPLDCLIYATGFEVGGDFTRRAGYEIHGRGGITLTRRWAGGAATLHGMHARGFPNCLIIGSVQAGAAANFTHMLDAQSRHAAYVVNQAIARGARTIEASQAAQDAWVEEILRLAAPRRKFLEDCTPGYFNNEGAVEDIAALNGPYGGGAMTFIRLLQAWRAAGSMAGLEITTEAEG